MTHSHDHIVRKALRNDQNISILPHSWSNRTEHEHCNCVIYYSHGIGLPRRMLLNILLLATLSSMRSITIVTSTFLVLFSALPTSVLAERSFSDVSPDHPAYEAVEYLKSKGVIGGYPDGTFQPGKKVNRAEAVKIIAAPRISADALAELKKSSVDFQDVPKDAWYMPYLVAAVNAFSFIDGPPKRLAFEGSRAVLKAEFIKMLLVANGVDSSATFGEIQDPLSADVRNTGEWYYPHMRTAIAYSLTQADEGENLAPARELTRSDVAIITHRFLMFQEERRTQALLSEAESEIARILDALGRNDVEAASRAATRSTLAARGAHLQRSDSPVTRGAVKIAQAFQELVMGYRAGLSQDFDATIVHAKKAWSLAQEAQAINPDLGSILDQVRQTSSRMADDARALGGKG